MTKCCAPNCVHSQKSTEYRFYEFPQDAKLRTKWIANIGRPNWTPGRRSMVCSTHFEKTQFKTENHQVRLLDGAIPTLFHSVRKRKGFQAIKSTGVEDVDNYNNVGEIEDKRVDHISTKTEDKFIKTVDAPLTGVMDSAKFMDEMVLIESPNSLMTCHSFITGDKISSDNTCYSSLENTLVLGEEGSSTQGNVIIVEPVNDTEIIVMPETPQTKPDSVILVQQPPQGLIASCKRSLNLAEIATPCSLNISTTGESGHPPEDDSQIQTQVVTVPSLKRRKLINEACNNVPVVEDPTPIKFCEVAEPLETVLPIEKGIVDLPVSLTHHIFEKDASPAVKWQDGTFMCRLCGIASNRTMNLFSPEASKIKVLERITSVLPIMIDQSDDLPQNVCSKCLSQLDACSELIVTSFNTHKQLASVMGQDLNQSKQMSVYFHERKKEDEGNPSYNRHILLMEIFHEEGKQVEEYLSIALEDLQMRLHPKRNGREKPECSMVLASISNSCIVSQVEQVKTAAEALISKGVIQDQRSEQVLLKSDDGENVFHDITDVLEQGLQEIEEITLVMNEAKPSVELPMSFELDLTDVQAMPVTDDVSPSDYYSTGLRCPKFQRVWKKSAVALKDMQNFVFWKTVDGEVKLSCKVCECDLDRNSSIQGHLKEHSDVSCLVHLAEFSYQHENDSDECDRNSPPPSQSSEKELQHSFSKGRFHPWFQCSFCSARFDSKPILKQHMLKEHAANTKCESCGYGASDVCEATLHRQKCAEVKKGKEWQCRKCLEIFSVEEELQRHQVVSGHSDVTAWLCDICGKSFLQCAKLNKHKKSHLPSEFKYIHQCPHCPKRYINSSRLKEHMQKHDEKKYMCKVCGKLFSTKQILRQHEFTHGDPQFLCSLCSRTFFRKSHLLKHMNVHNPDNSRASRAGPQPHRDGLNRCRECKNVYEQKELLLHYKLSHPQIQLQNYVCEICKEENTSYAELFQHQREVHKTGVKDCPFCDKSIESSTQMKYHLMRHEGMFPYNCPMCSNGYTANSVLQDHIRRKHTGEKPFECLQCSKRFPTNGALAQHNTVHSLPHQLLPCPVCNQGFKRKAHLDVHLRTHTGEKPYPCPICDRPFRQRPDCVKHIRVIHGEDPSNYDIRFHPNMCVTFPQVVADMELVLEGEDLMQASLEANQLLVSQ